MTDDEIIREADRIKGRRLNQARLDSFHKQATVSIRWDNPGTKFGESYTGITVDAASVKDVVDAYFDQKVR